MRDTDFERASRLHVARCDDPATARILRDREAPPLADEDARDIEAALDDLFRWAATNERREPQGEQHGDRDR